MKQIKKLLRNPKFQSVSSIFAILLFLLMFWLTPLFGGIWYIGELKPLPPRQLTQRQSDNEAKEIIQTFYQFESRTNNKSYLESKSDVCVKGQNNAKVKDGYANSCTLTITHFYSGSGEFRQSAANIGEQLTALGWNNTDEDGHKSKVDDIPFILTSYYDRYVGTSTKSTLEYKKLTGFDEIKYSLNNMPTATYYTQTKKRVDIQFNETDDNKNYLVANYTSIQHPANSGFSNYDRSVILDAKTINSKAKDLNGKFIVAVAISNTYFQN